MLVDADAGGVDHHDIALKGGRYRGQQSVPHSCFAPTHEAVVAGGRWPVALGHLSPWRACSKPPENTVQNTSVINPRNAARLVRQQRLNDRPFPVCQFVSPPRHQASITMIELKSHTHTIHKLFMSLRPRLYEKAAIQLLSQPEGEGTSPGHPSPLALVTD